MRLEFSKMHGLGNDFMVVDAIRQKAFFSPELIKRLGDRHFGVGFDQLLVVEPPFNPEHDFHYRIFNADGSEVQMCGNGARCFARFVIEQGLCNKNEIHVSTVSGSLVLKIEDDGEVLVNMGIPVLEPSKIPNRFDTKASSYLLPLAKDILGVDITTLKGIEDADVVTKEGEPYLQIGSVSMGNPHLTTLVKDINSDLILALGPYLERHSYFPEKVNVGFMQVLDRKTVKLRVYERGCGETLACGSGACAAVVAGIVQGHLDSKVKVSLPGGDLTISWQGNQESVMMKGPAVTTFHGYINL